MRPVALLARVGDQVVARILLPPFAVEPEIIVWGGLRSFVRQPDGHYREALVWHTPTEERA